MERSRLIEILDGAGEARLLSRKALESGGVYEVWPDVVTARNLVFLWEQRRNELRRSGKPFVGLDEALADLRAQGESKLATGYIYDQSQGGFCYQLFLDSQLAQVVTCFGMELARDPRDASVVRNQMLGDGD